VAAEALEQAARVARRERVVQVERGIDRPLPFPTPPSTATSTAGRPGVLDHARRDDPDHARVPPLSREHEAVGGVEVDPVHLAARLASVARSTSWRRRLSSSSSRAISSARCSSSVVSSSTPVRPLAQPPDRVEARREDEADAARGELPRVEPRRAHERAQAGVGRLGEELEAVAGEHAVLAAQRREVGDRRERDEVELAPHQRVLFAQRLGDGERELERHAGRAEAAVGLGVVRPGRVRVEHGEARRHAAAVARQVVVADDHVDAGGAQVGHGAVRARAAVAREHHRRAGLARGAHAGVGEVVPVGEAVRDERHRAPAEAAQHPHHERVEHMPSTS
jgi:hypothetical protein